MQPNNARILFIVNPNAGKRKIHKHLQKFKAYHAQFEVRATEYPQHCQQIIREEMDNYDVFVAVGGDGTVNEAATALAQTTKKLAVYPAGSGNGFAREYGFSKNIDQLLKAIETGKTIATDIIRLNGKASIHVSGVGYDGAVAHDFAKLKGRGFWNYFYSTMRVIVNFHPIEATIELENQTIEGQFFLIDLANSAQYGYGAKMAPPANPTDGHVDLVLVRPLSLIEFPVFALKLFLGILKPNKKLKYIACQSPLTIRTTETRFHIDGEAVLLASPVKVEIQQGALNVIDTGKSKF